MTVAERLHNAVAAVCPILGIGIGIIGQSNTVTIRFDPAATGLQQTNAQTVVNSFDWTDAAQAAWEADQRPERKDLRANAAQAVADIDTYLALVNPTNAQIQAQVRRLSQISRKLIQRLVQID